MTKVLQATLDMVDLEIRDIKSGKWEAVERGDFGQKIESIWEVMLGGNKNNISETEIDVSSV